VSSRPALMRVGRLLAAIVAAGSIAAATLASAAGVTASGAPPVPPTVDVQILAINDFHSALPPPTGGGGKVFGTPAGGIEYLATDIREREALNPNTLVLSAGDLLGASPLVSALFHDEPTVEAMDLLGLDYTVVGNHEFDDGLAELHRIQDGGCYQDDCLTGHFYPGADFRFLAANVVGQDGTTIFPPYAVRSFGGARVGIIGVITSVAPEIISPEKVAGLTFLDPTATVNRYAAELRKQGVHTIVVLMHEGNPESGTTVNGCPALAPWFSSMISGMDKDVRAVITGHSHEAYTCVVAGKVVTQASSHGRVFTRIDMTIDRATDVASSVSATNTTVTRDVTPDPAESVLFDKYDALAAPLEDAVVGSTTAAITRDENDAGETALGDVVSDGQLAATSAASVGGAQIAFTNIGGIRADLPAGDVTYGQAYAVQPFGNILQTFTMTGAQIHEALEQQFDNPNPGEARMLQVSDGFTYTWTRSGSTGSHVDPASIELDGAPISMTGTYRVTANAFLADGGDGFTAFRNGEPRVGGGTDTAALVRYITGHSPVAPGPQDRIAVAR
jgi:5'-nucleotidase